MTTEGKAKAYDEALKKAKQLHTEDCSAEAKDACEYIFPELAESEDERIRKELLIDIPKVIPYEKANRYIAWLEKQKEQKPAEWSEEDRLTLDSIISIVEDWESGQSEKEKEYYGATQKSDFLKSLRPTWKPSEGQMSALFFAKALLRENNCPENANLLDDIYDGLKKLM